MLLGLTGTSASTLTRMGTSSCVSTGARASASTGTSDSAASAGTWYWHWYWLQREREKVERAVKTVKVAVSMG